MNNLSNKFTKKINGTQSSLNNYRTETKEAVKTTLEWIDLWEYIHLANVQLWLTKLEYELWSKNRDKSHERITSILYKMLTTRSRNVEETTINNPDVLSYMSQFSEQQKWYRTTRCQLESFAQKHQYFHWDSNPGWFGIKTPELPEKQGINFKIYRTIPIREYTFIRYIPNLVERLMKIANNKDCISVKIPESLSWFMAHNDSLVVHFKNQENADKIQDTIDQWMKEFSIQEWEREMKRTKFAADPKAVNWKKISFSAAIAEGISTWIESHRNHFDSKVLAKEGITYAIQQSQKPPNFLDTKGKGLHLQKNRENVNIIKK